MPDRRPSRLLRLLLRLYPRAYRERYGAEIEAFEAEARATSGGGPLRALRLTVDHVAAARAVRRRNRGMGRGETMLQDLKWAARSLIRGRAYALFAILTLGLGVGATAAVYTVLDRVVLRPFPWDGADRLHHVGTFILGGDELEILSAPLLRSYIENLEGVEAIVGTESRRAVRTDADAPEQLNLLEVSPGYFDFFEGRPAAGRLLGDDDHAAAAGPVAVLTHETWTRRYGADPSVVGTTIAFDGVPYRIVGVVEAGFTAPRPAFWGDWDFVVPMGLYQREADAGSFGIRAAARLEPGVAPDRVEAQLTALGREIYGDPDGFVSGFGMRPLEELVLGEEIGRDLGRILAAVGLLLLIGCVNVASLMLTRARQRAAELRVRASLGATRGRLVSQLLAESVLLALAGGVAGSAIAALAVELFRRNAPGGIPRIAEVAFDPQVLGITLLFSLTTVLLFGLLPAIAASRGDLRPGTTRHGPGRRERAVRSTLVLVETGLAVVLVVWSGLLSRDLVSMAHDDGGFRSTGIVSAQLNLRSRPDGESDETIRSFYRSLEERARGLPGVTSVALATELPYSGNAMVTMMTPEGVEDVPPQGEWMPIVGVAGDWFETLGVRVVQGRPFGAPEDVGRMVGVVNEAFVRRYWPDRDPLGLTVKNGGSEVDDEGSFEVVGVIADIRTAPGEEPPPKLYVPSEHETTARMNLILETTGSTEAPIAALRAAVAELDPGLPIVRVETLDAVVDDALAAPTFYAALFSSFGMTALLLALVGVYGTTAYATASRSREIGIRVALGEDRERIVGRVLKGTAAVVAGGIVVGSIGALAAGRIGADALRLVEPSDPGTYLSVAAIVLAAALTAAWVPARRLTRIDPAQTLRREN